MRRSWPPVWDTRLPFSITGTHYKIERMVGGTSGADGKPVSRRWEIYERDGERDRLYEEDRPA